jgi:oxalate---CoA ligase
MKEITHADLVQLIENLQVRLQQLRLPPGSIVALTLPNSIEFVVIFLALVALGCTVAPLNPAYKRQELEHYLRRLSPHALIVERRPHSDTRALQAAESIGVATLEIDWNGSTVSLQPLAPISPRQGSCSPGQPNGVLVSSDTALLLSTSGTTGEPKQVLLRNAVCHDLELT